MNFISLEKLNLFLTKVKTLIPTRLSQLDNDDNYVQDVDYTDLKSKVNGIEDNANNYTLPVAASNILGGVRIGANITVDSEGVISVSSLRWTNIEGRPTKVSEFTNDTGFITKSVSDLANYYTADNTYSKTEINALLGDIKTIQIVKVDTLPATGQSNNIYLVPIEGGTSPNAHNEYIWVEATSSFELIGSTEIDLSGYWSKAELTEATSAEIEALFTA